MAFDTVILNGTIVDGSGRPPYRGDVGISDRQITAIGDLADSEAEHVIDAVGHVVAPGFIDIHGHSDLTLLEDPGGESKAYQGVTTEVTGNCSFSPFPAGKAGPEFLQRQLGKTLISRIEWTWHTLDDWARDVESEGISINLAPQVGHAALRVAAGALEDRAATPDEMTEMRRLAVEAVEQGAFSLSTGLSGAPSSYASADEIVALCEAIAHYDDVFYATHARVGAGRHFSSIKEAVEIGRRAEVPVQFSHLSITEKQVHGRGPEMLEIFEKARAGGLDITYDMYPYTAGGAGLKQVVPNWAQAGSVDDYLARLRDPATRNRIRTEVAQGVRERPPRWDIWRIAFAISEANQGLVGQSVEEIAADRGVEPAEAVLQMVEAEGGNVMTLVHNRVEGDVRYFLGHSLSMIGSDGRAISPHGFYGKGRPHPRFYGTYPRVLGRYVREQPSVLLLESAVYKMTGFPAQRLGLGDRGLVEVGMVADLVVFDPESVIDNATYDEPQQYPDGIPYVFLNGVVIVDRGRHTGARPGRVLRRGG